jgi:hypothetical protein
VRRVVPWLSTAWMLVAAASAWGVDGVLEINQTCAVSSGCFPGDAAGFPVTITTPGSVRLTSNLTVPNENTHAISVNSANVTVDLNGFAILGPTVCLGVPISCNPNGGVGQGIASSNPGITVLNGTVRGMGGNGIHLAGGASSCVGVRASSNGATGIIAHGGVVRDNVATSNGSFGIVSGGSTVLGNTITANFLGLGAGNTAYGHNQLNFNNGGNAFPQVNEDDGPALEVAPNVCGGDLICP